MTARNSNLSITLPGQQGRVAGRLDADLAQHLGDDDLDVLVVDFHALAAVDVLDFAHQVLLHGLFAGDAQDVVRHQRPVDQGLAGPDEVAGVDAQVLAVRDEVLAFDAALAADDDRPLAAALLAQQLDRAVDLGDDGRVLRLAGLEDFGHARQTAGDVLRARHFARRLGQQRAGRDLLAFGDFDVGLFGQVVEVENLAAVVFQDDLRVQVALVLDDRCGGRDRWGPSPGASSRLRCTSS